MKKFTLSLIITVMAISVSAFGVSAAVISPDEISVGPYEGTFQGMVQGDNNSQAPMTLELTHRDGIVQGKVTLGEGLYMDGGMCGGVNVPSGSLDAGGETLLDDPNRLEVRSTFDVNNIDITVDLTSELSPDGEVLYAEAKIDLPWICGKDPQLSGTLYKISNY